MKSRERTEKTREERRESVKLVLISLAVSVPAAFAGIGLAFLIECLVKHLFP